MQLCYLAFFEKPDDPAARISADDLAVVRSCVEGLTGLARANLYTPASASDIYNDDGQGPLFGMQLFFDAIEPLEAAVTRGGPFQTLAASGKLTSLSGMKASQQAMIRRGFLTPDEDPSDTACSYVVHYPGPAEDLNAWLGFYVENHPGLMARFPGIREIEILTRIDWIDAMPWQRVHHIQRNRILFDSPEALTEALHSPVRHEMRADFAKFPPYIGGNFHYPMLTEIVRPE